MKNLVDRLYFGWRVHAGAFIAAMFTVGCTSYIFGLFVVPITDEFDISRANVNLGFIAFLLGAALLSPVVGHLLDKMSARTVVCLGGLLFGLGMVVISRTDSLPLMLLMILGPISFAMNASGTLGANTIVARWFRNRRGKALGALAVATSLGGFIFTPLTAVLIDSFGWRDALMYVGLAAMLGIVLVVLLLIKNWPAGTEQGYEAEFTPDANDHSEAEKARANERRWEYRELLGNRNFWLLTFGIGLLYGSDMALVTSQVPHFQDAGIELPAAAMIASFMTVSAIGGKLLVGYLADRIDLRWIFHGVAVAHALLLVLYIILPPYWLLLVCATLLGTGIGGVFPTWATLLARLFGSKSYGSIMGLMTVVMNLLGIVALRYVGAVHDQTGSYVMAFATFISTILLSMVLISLLRFDRPDEKAANEPDESLSGQPSPRPAE